MNRNNFALKNWYRVLLFVTLFSQIRNIKSFDMKKYIIALTLTLVSMIMCAGEHPQAYFGEFGIKHYPSAKGYQKYVDETVVYFPQKQPTKFDLRFSKVFNGKIGVPYIISRVSGDEKTIRFEMYEKDEPENRVKFEFKNYDSKSNSRRSTFANTEYYQIPLFLIDRFNEAFKTSKETLYDYNDTEMQIDTMVLYYPEEGYPIPSYRVYNPYTNKFTRMQISLAPEIASTIGKKYTDDECVFDLTITDLYIKQNEPYREYYFTIYNSFTKDSKEYFYLDSVNGDHSNIDAHLFADSIFNEAKSGHYECLLSKVEKPSNPAIRYGETTEVHSEDNIKAKFSYIDNVIAIILFSNNIGIDIELKNISDHSIKVIWDDAAFVDTDGTSSKIMHIGTKYSERYISQPPTTIIKDAKIQEVVRPINRVYFDDKLVDWISKSIYPNEPRLEGLQVRLMLPIQIKDVINEYLFIFDIKYVYNHPELVKCSYYK